MIKKLIIAVLSMTLLLTCAACTNEAEETATANAEGYLTALCDGDFETAASYCTEEAFKETGIGELSSIDKRILKATGFKKSQLTKKAKASLNEFATMLQQDFLIDYQITEVEESKTGVIVKANVKYGYDMRELNTIKISSKESDKISEGYLDKNQEKLLKIYKDEGEDAMMAKIVSDLMPKFIDRYTKKFKKLETHTDLVQITLDKKKGKYIITDIASDGYDNENEFEVDEGGDDTAQEPAENAAE